MTKPTETAIITEAEREANLDAFCSGLVITPEIAAAIHHLIEQQEEIAEAYERFLRDGCATGAPDRTRLRDLLAAYGRSRHDILVALGADPESGDLLPLPADLHHS